jgi:hypothetical protein
MMDVDWIHLAQGMKRWRVVVSEEFREGMKIT